jgi:hypothetical protein
MSSFVPPTQSDQTGVPSPATSSDSDGQTTQPASVTNATIASSQPASTTTPMTSPSATQTAAFAAVMKSCRELKEKYVDVRITYYKGHTRMPRWMFRLAGVFTILLSVTLPALAAAVFPYKEVVLSATSIAIAFLTGLSSFYRWDRTWSGNSSSQVALEQRVAKWELELTNAQYLLAPDQQIVHVYQATNDLLTNASNIVSSESTGFFSGLQFPQQNTAVRSNTSPGT